MDYECNGIHKHFTSCSFFWFTLLSMLDLLSPEVHLVMGEGAASTPIWLYMSVAADERSGGRLNRKAKPVTSSCSFGKISVICVAVLAMLLRQASPLCHRQLHSLAQDSFFSYKLCFCWILFMGGTTNGFHMMSSSGRWTAFYPRQLYLCTVHISAVVHFASEPRDYECNGLRKHSQAVSTGTLTLGLFTTVVSVVYSSVRDGSSTALLFTSCSAGKPLLPMDKPEEREENEKAKSLSYSYAFFRIIFSLASMYSAMLLTGWSTSVGESGKLIDVGWPSVWVRVMTSWATAGLYIWSLLAPILFPEREF